MPPSRKARQARTVVGHYSLVNVPCEMRVNFKSPQVIPRRKSESMCANPGQRGRHEIAKDNRQRKALAGRPAK
jgi:hypothetical protein